MSYTLNKKLVDLTPYDPVSGNYKIRLDANESFLPFSDRLKNIIKGSVDNIDFNRYPDPYCKRLTKAFAEFYGISPDNVTVGNGSDELLQLITSSFLENGDKLLTFTPDFSMYAFYAHVAGHETLCLPKSEDMTIDIDEAVRYINECKINMVMFSNPCNPTSVGISEDEIRKLIKSVDALVVLDEAYMDFYGHSLIKEAHMYDNLILLRTCSKALGAAGVRLGFAVAGKTLTKALRAVKSPYNINSLSQAAGEAVFSDFNELKSQIKKIIKSRDSLYNLLIDADINVFEKIYRPDTNFVFIKTKLAKEIHSALQKRSVSIRCMGDSYLRITAGSDYENREVVNAVCDAVKEF